MGGGGVNPVGRSLSGWGFQHPLPPPPMALKGMSEPELPYKNTEVPNLKFQTTFSMSISQILGYTHTIKFFAVYELGMGAGGMDRERELKLVIPVRRLLGELQGGRCGGRGHSSVR